MITCLVSSSSSPFSVGIGYDSGNDEIFAMSNCCGVIIHYCWDSNPNSWMCSLCKVRIRYSKTTDAVRASASGVLKDRDTGGLFNPEELVRFIWWWTGYSEDDIKIEWTEE